MVDKYGKPLKKEVDAAIYLYDMPTIEEVRKDIETCKEIRAETGCRILRYGDDTRSICLDGSCPVLKEYGSCPDQSERR